MGGALSCCNRKVASSPEARSQTTCKFGVSTYLKTSGQIEAQMGFPKEQKTSIGGTSLKAFSLTIHIMSQNMAHQIDQLTVMTFRFVPRISHKGWIVTPSN